MITVINKPVFTVKCPPCGSVLTYDGSDIEYVRMGMRRYSAIYKYIITCPVCSARIEHIVENE